MNTSVKKALCLSLMLSISAPIAAFNLKEFLYEKFLAIPKPLKIIGGLAVLYYLGYLCFTSKPESTTGGRPFNPLAQARPLPTAAQEEIDNGQKVTQITIAFSGTDQTFNVTDLGIYYQGESEITCTYEVDRNKPTFKVISVYVRGESHVSLTLRILNGSIELRVGKKTKTGATDTEITTIDRNHPNELVQELIRLLDANTAQTA